MSLPGHLMARPWAVIVGIVALTAVVLLAMGRVPICTCGTVRLWHGVVFSAENSQHLTDWYSFTHLIHGFLFYGMLGWIARRWPAAWRLVAAVAIESGWEILENTNFVIDRYRKVTISLDYFGDSVLNSVSDIAVMIAGFQLAAHLRVWASLVVVLGLEVFLAAVIRDNLTLNVLMLLAPSDAIRAWQAALP